MFVDQHKYQKHDLFSQLLSFGFNHENVWSRLGNNKIKIELGFKITLQDLIFNMCELQDQARTYSQSDSRKNRTPRRRHYHLLTA
jgi:hypothetical protein